MRDVPRIVRQAWDEKIAGRDCEDMAIADATKVVVGSLHSR